MAEKTLVIARKLGDAAPLRDAKVWYSSVMTEREITRAQHGDLKHAMAHISTAVNAVLNAERVSRHQLLVELMTAQDILAAIDDSLPALED